MDPDTTATTGITARGAGVAGRIVRPTVLLTVGLLAAGLFCLLAVAPAVVGFTLTVGVAAAWCSWLERHPDPRTSSSHSAPGTDGRQG